MYCCCITLGQKRAKHIPVIYCLTSNEYFGIDNFTLIVEGRGGRAEHIGEGEMVMLKKLNKQINK